jgi:16S rRNA (cytidine1402-2'-O)-methyltransferase
MTLPSHPGYTVAHGYCMAHLYIVATPIGNLGDITFRAVEILKSCHTIACEDTRHSRKLLTHCGVSRPLLSCRGQNMAGRIPAILTILGDGGDVAYLSDAGTPGISDPGSSLVRAVRAAGYPIVPIPGPSAVTALVSVSGVAGRGWSFEGFLPPKGKKRLDRMRSLIARGEPVVFYESPHRMGRFLEELRTIAPGHRIVLGREMTKLHEQIVVGTVEEIANMVDNSEIPLRGEFVVLVSGGKSC